MNNKPIEKNIASLRAAAIDDRIKKALPLTAAQGMAACARIMNLQSR